MLKAIGVEAHPIIIMTNDEESVDRCIPSLDGNHAITRVFLPDGREIFLDATAYADKYPYFRSDDQGVSFVDAIGREIGTTSTNIPEENSERIDVDMQIDENGDATAEFRSLPSGMREGDYRSWWEFQQPERFEQIFTNWMNGIFPQASLDTFSLIGLGSLDSQLVEWAKVSVDSFPTVAGDMWILTVPGIARSMVGFGEVNLAERKFDIEYTAPYQEEYYVKIHLPKGAKIIALPDAVELKCEPYADFSLKFKKSGRSIIVSQRFRLKERIVPVSDFERYKNFIISAKQAVEKRAFVRKPG
ncbi:hypothetical protein DRQ26_05165 [bacterium]|nr:MAG: hypothetical protein DRQ26_05165 [bacterium]